MSIKRAGLTVEQTAAELGIGENRVRSLLRENVLSVNRVGRATLVELPDTFLLADAARIMGITDSWCRALIRNELLVGIKLGPRAWVVELREIRRFNLTPKATAKGRPRISAEE